MGREGKKKREVDCNKNVVEEQPPKKSGKKKSWIKNWKKAFLKQEKLREKLANLEPIERPESPLLAEGQIEIWKKNKNEPMKAIMPELTFDYLLKSHRLQQGKDYSCFPMVEKIPKSTELTEETLPFTLDTIGWLPGSSNVVDFEREPLPVPIEKLKGHDNNFITPQELMGEDFIPLSYLEEPLPELVPERQPWFDPSYYPVTLVKNCDVEQVDDAISIGTEGYSKGT